MVFVAGSLTPGALFGQAATPEVASRDCEGAASKECRVFDVVVVGTRTKERRQRSTIRTGVVTRAEAERRGARNVGEALAGETTLQVNPEAYGYLGRPSGVQMQGLDAERVLILEDGERVSGDVGGVVDLAELPLTDVERIEYVTGPTSSLYGTNALGGVINVVSSAPQRQGASGRGRLEARSRGDLLGEASAAYRRDEHWLSLDVGHTHAPSEAAPAADGDTLVPRLNSHLLGLRAGTAPTERLALRVKLRWVHDAVLGRSSQQVPGLSTYLLELPEVTERVSAHAQQSLELTTGSRLDFSLSRSWFRGESKRDRVRSPLDEARLRTLDTFGFESTLTIQDGKNRTWVLGVRTDTEQFGQELERTQLIESELRTSRTPEVERTQLGSGALFAQLTWLWGKELTALPGVRAELHGRYGSIVAPRLAAAYRPSEQLSLRGAFGRGFRAPSAKEYGFVFDHSAIGYRVLGNAELKPEQSWGITGDVTFKPSAWLLLRAGGFGNWVRELIATDLADQQASAAVTDYTYVNVSRAMTAGGDAQARFSPSPRVRFDAGYAHLWTRDETRGEPLPTRPTHTLTLGLVARTRGRLEASARYRWVSSSFVATEVRAPAFGSLDLRVGCRLWRDVQAYARVLNSLNERKDPARVGDARPPLGRNFYLGLRGELPGTEATDDHD